MLKKQGFVYMFMSEYIIHLCLYDRQKKKGAKLKNITTVEISLQQEQNKS